MAESYTTIVNGRQSHPGKVVDLLVIRTDKVTPGVPEQEAAKVAAFLRDNLPSQTLVELKRQL